MNERYREKNNNYKMMSCNYFVIILVIIMAFNVYARFPDYGNDNKIRVWEPVMEQDVLSRLYNFLLANNITNCYEFEEERSHLLLKCWSNEFVVDVSIMTRNKYPFITMHQDYSSNIVAC